MKQYARLAALGALGVAAGALGLWALIVWAARPTPTGGIDGTNAFLTVLSVGIPALAVAAAHVAYARILSAEARRG